METSVYIHTLAFIILLRVANVKLAPLFARWKDVPLQHCFELHEILCLQHHGDVLANHGMIHMSTCSGDERGKLLLRVSHWLQMKYTKHCKIQYKKVI